MDAAAKDKERLAVALAYSAEMVAPQVVASGRGEVARRLIEVARQHDVPLVEDEALALALSHLPLQGEIPPKLYGAVAAILAYLYRLDRELGGES